MLKKIISIFLTAFLLATIALAHNAELTPVQASGYVSIRLNPQILARATSDLRDLRIIDENSEYIPYFLHSTYSSEGVSSISQTDETSYELPLVNSFVEDDMHYFDFELQEEFDHDILANSITLYTARRNFAKEIILLGSHDGIYFENVLEDTIYVVDGEEKLTLNFSDNERYTYYRLGFLGNDENIKFSGASLVYSEYIVTYNDYTQSFHPVYTIDEQETTTIITLSGVKNLRLANIAIIADDVFSRDVLIGENRYTIENSSFNGVNYSNTIIDMLGSFTNEDTLTLTIENNDDAPIDVSDIILSYHAIDVIFNAKQDMNYALEFGDTTLTAPVYDITNFADEILKTDVAPIEIEDIQFSEQQVPTEAFDYTIIFNIVIVLVAIILAIIALSKIRKTTKEDKPL